MDPVQLDHQHELFCQEYVTDSNATRAAIAAGYTPAHAANQGYRLLDRLDVQLRIEQLKLEVIDSIKVTREMVIQEYARIAMTDRRALRNTSMDDLTDDQAACIDGFKFKDGMLSEIKTVSKAPALRALGEHFNIFQDHQKSGTGEIHVHIEGKDTAL